MSPYLHCNMIWLLSFAMALKQKVIGRHLKMSSLLHRASMISNTFIVQLMQMLKNIELLKHF